MWSEQSEYLNFWANEKYKSCHVELWMKLFCLIDYFNIWFGHTCISDFYKRLLFMIERFQHKIFPICFYISCILQSSGNGNLLWIIGQFRARKKAFQLVKRQNFQHEIESKYLRNSNALILVFLRPVPLPNDSSYDRLFLLGVTLAQ